MAIGGGKEEVATVGTRGQQDKLANEGVVTGGATGWGWVVVARVADKER